MTIQAALRRITLGLAVLSLLMIDVAPDTPRGVVSMREAQAIIGAPMTPVSYAGVARRTTRRVVVATSATATTAAAATSSQQAATAQQQQAVAQQQAATAQQQQATAKQQAAVAEQQTKAAGPPATGSVVPTLPAGCAGTVKSGVQYYQCGTVSYRAAFQGNNLVYVVQ